MFTIGLGSALAISRKRVPNPPQNNTTFIQPYLSFTQPTPKCEESVSLKLFYEDQRVKFPETFPEEKDRKDS